MGVLEVQRGLLASEFWKNLKPYKCIVVKSSGIAGESVGGGQKAFVQEGEIRGAAPKLAQYEAEV